MDASTVPMTRTREPAAQPDLEALKARQRAAWSSGDYAIVGTTLQIVGEELCEALDVRAGQRVLDVAAGNGNVSLAAARRWCDVVASDYVPALLERARERAAAERLDIEFREADAEALPFPNASFDVVVSTFGVMFTPDQEMAASEMLRVVKSGGKIGLANWTPEGFIGQVFKTIGRHLPPPPGARSPALWGTRTRIAELFGLHAASISTAQRHFVFRYRSPAHWLEVFGAYYGPLLKAFAALEPASRTALERDLTGADRAVQPRAGRLHGRARRVPRGRRHQRLTSVGLEPTGKEEAMTHVGRSFRVIRLTAVTLGLGAMLALAPSDAGEMHHTVVPADAVAWGPAPPSLPPGAQAAVLLGNPAKEGPFVLRLKFPAGYAVPPHRHSKDELLTVIAGGSRSRPGRSWIARRARSCRRRASFTCRPACRTTPGSRRRRSSRSTASARST